MLTQNLTRFFFDLLELEGTTANTITETLLLCLHKYGFDDHFLGECFVAFVCDGASVMVGRKAGVATQLCARFPDLFVWHCLNHCLELVVGDVLKEVSGLNHFKIFFDKLYTLYHASPKNQRELHQHAQCVGQRLLVSGRVLSIRWVASSERTVKAVWENYRALQTHFSSAAHDVTRDSTERAKYKGLLDVLTSVSFVCNLGVMYDALTELSDLSRMLQKRGTTLPEADRMLFREIRVFESMVSTPGPHTQTVLQAETEKLFQNVSLCDNQRIVKINVGQFFRSMAENMRSRTATTTSSHVSTQESSSHRGGSKLMSDFKVLQPDTWPEGNLDIQHGEAEVLRLCDTFKIERRESI